MDIPKSTAVGTRSVLSAYLNTVLWTAQNRRQLTHHVFPAEQHIRRTLRGSTVATELQRIRNENMRKKDDVSYHRAPTMLRQEKHVAGETEYCQP